jgi:perosamine synthetase
VIRYPLARADYGPLEEEYVLDWMRNCQGPDWRQYIGFCEDWFRVNYGRKHALYTSSCDAALYLAYRVAFRLTQNRIVVMPDLTFGATPNAAARAGLTVTTEDVDPHTWTVKAWTESGSYLYTPVYLFGAPSNTPRERSIVDAAEALGSDPEVGVHGWITCFSFNGSKNLGAGEGGLLLTDDDQVYEEARLLWDQGREGKSFDHKVVGLNARPNPIGAALLYGQLARIHELANKKRELNAWYREALDGWRFQEPGDPDLYPAWWLTNVLLPEGVDPDAVHDKLLEQGIETRRMFRPISGLLIHDHRGERHARRTRPNSWYIYDHALSLPSAVQMTRDDVHEVCRALEEAVAQ